MNLRGPSRPSRLRVFALKSRHESKRGLTMDERPLVHAPELAGAGGWINVAEPLSLAKLRGKVVLLDFWTFCCINCLHIIEELRPLEEAYPNDLVVVGVHSPKFPEEQDHAAVERAVARHRIMHPVLDDPDMITWRRYGVRAWPTLALIDARGYVRWMGSGEGYGPALLDVVGRLIDESRENGSLRSDLIIRGTGGSSLQKVAPERSALAYPGKVASDGAGRLAIADTGHDRVLICTLDGAIEREITGLSQPQGVAFDGGRLIVCDTIGDEVVAFELRATPPPAPPPAARGEGSTVGDVREPTVSASPLSSEAGEGPGEGFEVLASGISSPWDVALWRGGIAVAEAGRHRLWWIAPDGQAEVLAGTSGENIVDGPALEALLAQPSGLSVGSDDTLYFADSEVSALRQLKDGIVTTLVGKGLFEWGTEDGDGETARLQHPLGVAAAPDGSVYVADTFNSLLRLWKDSRLTTLPVEGMDEPGGLCLLPDGRLAVADTNNHRILLVDPATGAAERLPLPETTDPDQPPAHDLPEAATVDFTLDLDLEGDELDPRDGPPIRVSVSAEPPSLLGAGPRVWAEASLPVSVQVRTARGEGALYVDVQAASCLGEECRLHRRRITLPVRLTADAEEREVRL
jgi:thiol-disulfide isomerase/thioredoxin/sugar lactone lactonase YvrE